MIFNDILYIIELRCFSGAMFSRVVTVFILQMTNISDPNIYNNFIYIIHYILYILKLSPKIIFRQAHQ